MLVRDVTMEEITETKIKELVTRWAAESGKSEKEIYERIVEKEKEAQERNPALSGVRLKGQALTLTYSSLEPTKISDNNIRAIIVGQSGIIDWMAIKERTAEYWYRVDKDKAINEGRTDTEGVPLDNRTFVYDKGEKIDNPFHLMPISNLPEKQRLSQLQRKIIAIKDRKIIIINSSGDKAKQLKVIEGTEVSFSGKPKQNTDNEYTLFSDQFIIEKEGLDIEEELRKVGVKSLSDVKGDNDKFVIVEGAIFEMQFRNSDTVVVLGDYDADYQIIANVNKEINIRWGKDSRVVLIGQKTSKPNKDNTKDVHRLSAYALVPVDGMAYPLKTVETPAIQVQQTTTVDTPSGNNALKQILNN